MSWFFNNETERKAAIYDNKGNQLFETVGLISIQINPTKSYSEQKLENGKVVTENVINNRTIININIILDANDYLDVYKEIKAAYDADTEFSIQTRVDTYDSFYIDSMPHEESGDIANTIAINLSFIEQQIADTNTEALSTSDVAEPSDASTTESGQKSTTEPTPTVLDSVVNFIRNIF